MSTNIDLTKKARTYKFENRSFSTEEIDLIASQKGLVGLSFKDCSITDDEVAKFTDFPKLVNLLIKNSSITDKSLEYISKFPKLRYLFLSGANITGTGLAFFKENKKIDTIWLNETQLNDKYLPLISNFSKLGTLLLHNTPTTFNGLMNVACNTKVKIIGKHFSTSQIETFEAEQRKLNKKKLLTNPEDIKTTKALLLEFFEAMTEWEKEAERDGFTQKVKTNCVFVFKKYCTNKKRSGYRPDGLSFSAAPNHTYTNQKIIDEEQQTKNKIILYTKDTYLDFQYRYIILRREGEWKIDEGYFRSGAWSKCGL